MTGTQLRTFYILVDGLWSGEIGQAEFLAVGEDAGIPAERLQEVLREVREEDQSFGF